MRKPTIDELLQQVDSIYELTMLAAKEARRIRMRDREGKEKQPLQRALERIAEGKVKGRFVSEEEMRQIEAEERQRREAARAMREKPVIRMPADFPSDGD